MEQTQRKNSKSSVVWKSKVKWWERSAANSTESLETSTETQPLNLTWKSYLWLQKCHLYKRGIRRQTGRLSSQRGQKRNQGGTYRAHVLEAQLIIVQRATGRNLKSLITDFHTEDEKIHWSVQTRDFNPKLRTQGKMHLLENASRGKKKTQWGI